MTIKGFRLTHQNTEDNIVLQTAIRDCLAPITANPLLDQSRILQVKVSAVTVDIPHNLGRRWLGWIVTRSNAGIIVYEAPKQAAPDKYISLVATGNGVIDLYIF